MSLFTYCVVDLYCGFVFFHCIVFVLYIAFVSIVVLFSFSRSDLAYFDGLNETILSVALIKPKPGIACVESFNCKLCVGCDSLHCACIQKNIDSISN